MFGSVLPGGAESIVTGTIDFITVEARGATLEELVGALSQQTGRRIDLEGSDDRAIDGAYRGSVEDVLGQILRNTSFVISQRDGANGSILVITLLTEPK